MASPDREALRTALRDAGLFAVIRENVWACDEQNFGATMRPIYDATLDALLPLLTDALDRARQQGRDDAAEAIQFRADAWRNLGDEDRHDDGAEMLAYAARLARGADRKDEETS